MRIRLVHTTLAFVKQLFEENTRTHEKYEAIGRTHRSGKFAIYKDL